MHFAVVLGVGRQLRSIGQYIGRQKAGLARGRRVIFILLRAPYFNHRGWDGRYR